MLILALFWLLQSIPCCNYSFLPMNSEHGSLLLTQNLPWEVHTEELEPNLHVTIKKCHIYIVSLSVHVIFLFPLKSCMLPTAICLRHQSSHDQLTGGGRAEDLCYEKFQRHAKTMRIGQCASTYPSSRFNNNKNLPH